MMRKMSYLSNRYVYTIRTLCWVFALHCVFQYTTTQLAIVCELSYLSFMACSIMQLDSSHNGGMFTVACSHVYYYTYQ